MFDSNNEYISLKIQSLITKAPTSINIIDFEKKVNYDDVEKIWKKYTNGLSNNTKLYDIYNKFISTKIDTLILFYIKDTSNFYAKFKSVEDVSEIIKNIKDKEEFKDKIKELEENPPIFYWTVNIGFTEPNFNNVIQNCNLKSNQVVILDFT